MLRSIANISIVKRIQKSWNSQSASGTIFRNMATLAGSAMIVRALSFLVAPVITRIYLPEHMGVLAVFTAFTAMLIPFSTLRYSMAIPLPKHDATAVNLMIVSFGLILLLTVTTAMVFGLFAEPLLSRLSMEPLVAYKWLIPLAILSRGIYELLSSWAIREKAFKPLARTKIWQSIFSAVSKIGLGLVGLRPAGLLIGNIISESAGISTLFRSFREKFTLYNRKTTWKRSLFLLKYYAEFPKYRLPSQFILSLANRMPVLFFAWHFGVSLTGQLGLAMIMIKLPMQYFGTSTGQAYYAEIAKIGKKEPEKILALAKNITKKLFVLSVPMFLGLVLLGPFLFSFVFGPGWRVAGQFTQVLALNLATMFISQPIVHTLNVFGQQHKYFQINIVRFIISFVTFAFCYYFSLSAMQTLLAYSLALSFHRVFVYRQVMNSIKSEVIKRK